MACKTLQGSPDLYRSSKLRIKSAKTEFAVSFQGLLVRTFFEGLRKGFMQISPFMLFHVKEPL